MKPCIKKPSSHQEDTIFYVETLARGNHKLFSFLFFLNSLHRFVGTDLLEAPTPNMCKKILAIGYNLIEAPTLKMCKKPPAIGYNMIEAQPQNGKASNCCIF